MAELKLFLKDKDRGISIRNFCEIAGISERLFTYVIHEEKMPMSENVQRSLNRAYRHWKEGRLKVMKKRNNETYPDYRSLFTANPGHSRVPRITCPAADGGLSFLQGRGQ